MGFSNGAIEAHFHFFIIIGFIALYQDWVPFLWNVVFTVLSHGIGTIWLGGQIFNHPAAQAHPWLWSFIHGIAVLLACVGMVIFWRVTEDEQHAKEALGRRLVTADAEIGRRQFTSDMLINLARRNQSMLYRQLDIINHLEDKEQDPDALADLFALDHLAPGSAATPRACWSWPASSPRAPGRRRWCCATSSAPPSPRPRTSTAWCSPSTTRSPSPGPASPTSPTCWPS